MRRSMHCALWQSRRMLAPSLSRSSRLKMPRTSGQILAIRDELNRLVDVEHKETEALTAQAKAEKIVEDARAKRREKMKQEATQRQADCQGRRR
jgi:hypothetical protein